MLYCLVKYYSTGMKRKNCLVSFQRKPRILPSIVNWHPVVIILGKVVQCAVYTFCGSLHLQNKNLRIQNVSQNFRY